MWTRLWFYFWILDQYLSKRPCAVLNHLRIWCILEQKKKVWARWGENYSFSSQSTLVLNWASTLAQPQLAGAQREEVSIEMRENRRAKEREKWGRGRRQSFNRLVWGTKEKEGSGEKATYLHIIIIIIQLLSTDKYFCFALHSMSLSYSTLIFRFHLFNPISESWKFIFIYLGHGCQDPLGLSVTH